MQFAGLRTDLDLNPVGEPLVIYARPANDFLPQPQACLVTGISPQQALAEGLPECEFMARIHAELARPGTCGVGYNSLRFDDEVTRYSLYRNFFDPYAREWQNGNSRWDIIDMLRTAWALRPQGIEWPRREDGHASFRLEELTAANGIAHEAAHDALSDVYATIAMARLLRERQPRLFNYLFGHRDKRSVSVLLDVAAMKPVLHVSGMFGAERHFTSLVVPLAVHPCNRNEIICYDLMVDPAPLVQMSPEDIQTLLYTRSEELPVGVERPGLKSIHLNRCPVVVPAKMADAAIATRIGLDGERCRRHLVTLREMRQQGDAQTWQQRWQAIYSARALNEITDPDRMLYSGGFFSDADRRTMDRIRTMAPAELAGQSFVFEDDRLAEMLFRYRARNYPDTLNEQEFGQWEDFRYQRLTDPAADAGLCLETWQQEIEALLAAGDLPADKEQLLQDLLAYGDFLLA